MKFQNPTIHRSKVNGRTHTQTDRQTDRQTDKPKAICPSNFFKVGGIKIVDWDIKPVHKQLMSNMASFCSLLV